MQKCSRWTGIEKRIRKQRKTSVRERFGLFTLEFAEFAKGFVEVSKKKRTYLLKSQSDTGFASAIVCHQAGKTCHRQK